VVITMTDFVVLDPNLKDNTQQPIALDGTGMSIRDKMLCTFFLIAVLMINCYGIHVYMTRRERAELEEEERRRIEQLESDERKVRASERNEIAKAIESYSISMTTLSSSSSSNKDRTIPNGNEENLTERTKATKFVLSNDEDEIDDQSNEQNDNNNDDIEVNDDDADIDKQNKAKNEFSSSISASRFLKAVSNNPCMICLEAFKSDDSINLCSNNVREGGNQEGYPHCFHQECTLNYLVTHPEKLQAPCPCCRKVFLCSPTTLTTATTVKEEEGAEESGIGNTVDTSREAAIIQSHHLSVPL